MKDFCIGKKEVIIIAYYLNEWLMVEHHLFRNCSRHWVEDFNIWKYYQVSKAKEKEAKLAEGGIWTHEACAVELESTPFDHSGTPASYHLFKYCF